MAEDDKTGTPAGELVLAPVDGLRIRIEHVTDPVFALELLGRARAIEPTSSTVRAPVSGTIVFLPDTLHAIGIASDAGAELLIHIGIDTIGLRGAPFSPAIKLGDHVEAGDKLVEVDFDMVQQAELPKTVITIVTNTDSYAVVEKLGAGLISTGDPLMRLIPHNSGIQSLS